mmetsp:Transcript_33300/g.82799  ORF Transcript_33300/g.82799 Transcript_33300/m.82799 type:complete len:328 (+) Transcript_33300:526-1509(+)
MTVPLSVRDKGCAHTAPPLQPRGERANIKLAPFRGAAVPACMQRCCYAVSQQDVSLGSRCALDVVGWPQMKDRPNLPTAEPLRVLRSLTARCVWYVATRSPPAAANLVRPQLVRDAAGVDHPSAPPQATVHVVVDRVCLFAALQGADKPIAREVVAGAHVVRYSLPSGALDGLRDQLAVAVADDRMTEEDAHEIEEMLTDTYGHGRRGAGPLYRLRGARRSPRAAVGSIHFGHRAKPPCRTAHLAGRAGAAAERAPAAPPPSPPPPSPPFPPPPAAPAAAEVGAAADDVLRAARGRRGRRGPGSVGPEGAGARCQQAQLGRGAQAHR